MADKDTLRQSTLASYAVMKALTDSKDYRNSYEILADFIRYLIVDRKWYNFSITDVSNALQREFGFDNIPLPAIRTSLRQIRECKKNGDDYVLPKTTSFKTDTFQRMKQISSEQSQSITQRLADYAVEMNLQGVWLDSLEEAFIKYILDDAVTIDQKYSDIISKFILDHENDAEFKRQISQIREGSILYCGLAYNISELGSLTSDLTLYLDTEVLFNIVGYNGVLYQKLAEDFLNQVKAANAKQRRIKLRFFNEVRLEIEGFFNSAENVIRGHGDLITSTAMKSIVNGCDTVSDVRDKEADFFYKLQYQYGIIQDEKKSYYTEADYPYNIEAVPEEYPKDERSFEAVRFISHINKLRKGQSSGEYTSCGYLFVTETRRIQEISNALRINKYECGYALPTSAITNILWYKLGSGFSKKEYPINTDASFKARGILSGEIASSIIRLYEETKKQYGEGKLDRDQVAARILVMREKNRTPDELTSDNIEELLDFTPEYIAKFEEGIKQNQVQLQEKQNIIVKLELAKSAGEKQKTQLVGELAKTVEERNASLLKVDEQNETIQKQNEELERYRAKEKKHNDRVEWWKKFGKFLCGILIIGASFALAVYGVTKVLDWLAPEMNNNVNLVIDAAGIIGFIFTGVKVVWAKVYNKDTDTEDNRSTSSS